MPIYEFDCKACGARFERLVDAGTEDTACPECRAEGARRMLSPQAALPRLAKSPRARRKQERQNAVLRASARTNFKQGLKRARNARTKRGNR
ncbi:MAG: FmdB family zinc ribbon protein [Solirubrobacterales bacterium]